MNTPKDIAELDETRARALYAVNPKAWWLNQPSEFDTIPLEVRGDLLKEARAIREADARAGLVTVPHWPEFEQLKAAAPERLARTGLTNDHGPIDVRRVAYRCMVYASPFYTEPTT